MQTKQIVIAISAALMSASLFAAQTPDASASAAKAPAAPAVYPVAQASVGLAPAADVAPEARTADQWVSRMSDFTKNASAFKDPASFNAWLNAMTDASMVPAMGGAMLEPGNWLRMMTTMVQPGTVTNYMQFMDPMVSARWGGAMIDPMFYTRMMMNMADPGKMMRWVMLPMDPKVWGMGMKMLDPNLYMKFMMMPTDPRGMALMFAPMNPQLYGSMMSGVFNTQALGPTWNTFMNPAQPVVSVQPPAPVELPINVVDPRTWGNMLNMVPGLSLPGAGQNGGLAFPLNLLGGIPGTPGMPVAGQSGGMAFPLPFGNASTNPYLALATQQQMIAQAAPFAIQAGVPAKMTLAGDALFKSGKSSVKDLTAEGKQKLNELVGKVKAFGAIDAIKVTGHADKMGKANANKKLSLARAKTIASYLKNNGVKAASFTTAGMGDTKPVVDCDMKQATDALKACLAPNRRVEVEVTGAKK